MSIYRRVSEHPVNLGRGSAGRGAGGSRPPFGDAGQWSGERSAVLLRRGRRPPLFAGIVARFYDLVADDPILRPLYPEEDLGPAEVRFRMFLEQYWGGPRTYSDQRGHPRLRMRHAPFKIGPAERDAWLAAINTAVVEAPLTEEQRARLWDYLVMAADSMVNSAH